MTHDLLEEALILLRGVPKLEGIGPRRMGSRINIRTLFRWATKGVCGVVLETTVQGGMRYTSAPAVRRFFAAVTAAKERQRGGRSTPRTVEEQTSRTETDSELDRLGI